MRTFSIPVLLFAVLFGSNSARADEALARIEEYKISCDRIQAEIESVRLRIKDTQAAIAGFEASRDRALGWQNDVETIKKECAELLGQRARFIEQARINLDAARQPLVRRALGNISTRDGGKSYQAAEVRAILPEGVRISHQDGSSLIARSDLPAEMVRPFGYLLQAAIEAAAARELPEIANLGLQADGTSIPKIKSKDDILSEERHLTDAERLVNAMAAEATFKRAEAKALMAKSKPGDKLHERAVTLREQAREIEQRLGLPSPKEE
jgi:hypothetical protein